MIHRTPVARFPSAFLCGEIDRLLTVRERGFPDWISCVCATGEPWSSPIARKPFAGGVTVNDARARPSILDDVAVRAARDGARFQGDGGGQDPGPPPRGGVLQRHHGQERGIRGERSRRGGQAGASAGVLQPRQVRAPAIRARYATLRRDRHPGGDARATPRGSRRAPAGPNPPPFCHPGPTSRHAWLTPRPLTPRSTGFPAWSRPRRAR